MPVEISGRAGRAVAIASLLLCLGAGRAPAAEGSAAAAIPRLEPSACATETLTALGAQCFTFHGEENWTRPNGTRVRLPVAVIEPASPPASEVPVFFFPGGPGYSSLDSRDYLEQLRKDIGGRTLVTMDHRGFVHAEPTLDCAGYAAVSPYHNIVHTPAITASLDPLARARILTRAVADCYRRLKSTGVDVSQYNAWSVSRDVNEIRRLLGYGQIDLYGSSTGSGTAVSFIQYHPDAVRAAVLGWPWFNHLRNRSPIDELGVAKQTFTDALALCVADDPACRDLLPDWLRGIDRARRLLDARPYLAQVKDADGHSRTLYFDGAAFIDTLYLTLADHYAELASIVAGINAGDYSRLDELFRIDAYDPAPQAPRYALGYFLAHVCNDMGRNRPTPEDALAWVRREPAVIGFEPPWLCAWWGEDGDVPAEHNDPPVTDTPALAVHGQMDPCCGARWSRHLQRTMPNLQYVVYQALGHDPINECRTKMIRDFLDDPLRAVDDGCRDEVPLDTWVLNAPAHLNP